MHLATLDVTNGSSEMVIYDPKEILSILDLRVIGYYKIKQGILQQNLRKYYRFESADILCKQFYKFINMLKKEKKKAKKKSLVEQGDERETCQTETEKY